MTKPDSNSERERLGKHYAAMTREELQELAENAWSLTDVAREALKSELSRRGLALELRESPPANPPMPGVVTLRQFRDLPDALLAKSVLDSAGIDSFLQDENTIRLDWLWSNALGGIKLLVREADAADAASLLEQKPGDAFETSSGEYKQPRCPVCGSTDVSFGVKGRSLSYATVAVGVPLPVSRRGWRCTSCGHEWNGSSGSDPSPQ